MFRYKVVVKHHTKGEEPNILEKGLGRFFASREIREMCVGAARRELDYLRGSETIVVRYCKEGNCPDISFPMTWGDWKEYFGDLVFGREA